MMVLDRIDVFFVPLRFDQGLSVGEGSEMNRLTVARDGQGRPVLRGTSIAGILRHQESTEVSESIAEVWFGGKNSQTDEASDSCVHVDTAVLEIGQSDVVESTHHLRNRHTGVVTKHGLFSMESCPPGTKATIAIWVHVQLGQENEANEFTKRLCKRFGRGHVFGGRSARGVGAARLDGPIRGQSFDMKNHDSVAAYLEDSRTWRRSGSVPVRATGLPIDDEDTLSRATPSLRVNLKLRIPRGQDLLIADGDEPRPQRVKHADGKEHWKLPGSTLRGLFKSWMTRLAARDGASVQDTLSRYEALEAGDERERYPSAAKTVDPNCPINDLFGTIAQAGRIHFTDAYADSNGSGKVTDRTHVAIDRVTGESADGLLFRNKVLSADDAGHSPVFKLAITIEEPKTPEVEWLARSVVALNAGMLRVGSSKASGRLEFVGIPAATGEASETFDSVIAEILGIKTPPQTAQNQSVPTEVGQLSRSKKKELVVSCENFRELRIGKRGECRIGKKLVGFSFDDSELPIAVKIELANNKPVAVHRLEIHQDAPTSESPASNAHAEVADESVAVKQVWSEEPQDRPQSLDRQALVTPNDGRFHNPYTFVEFETGLYNRDSVTHLSGDESSNRTLTGYMDLEVELLRPLLSCQPNDSPSNEHQSLEPLTIGNDVVLPATGVRGSLTTLMTILTSGTLGYINRNGHLCHKRDLPLSTDGEENRSRGVLAEIVTVGSHLKPGTVRLGETQLVHLDELHKLFGSQRNVDALRPQSGRKQIAHRWIELDSSGSPISRAEVANSQHDWKLKLSGRPVGWGESKNKYEGLFQPSEKIISLDENLWQDYAERNKRGSRPQLQIGDVVWLEIEEGTSDPVPEESVRSIQWARWGKKGERVAELAGEFKPDYLSEDGLVDEVTNLFGQVVVHETGDTTSGNAFSFAGKIRPDNLVFESAAAITRQNRVALPLLAQPNGGCIPFYRKADGAHDFRRDSPLRGYKVYRVEYDPEFDEPQSDQGSWIRPKPWEYAAQPAYSRGATPLPPENKLNKTVCLVPAGNTGRLRINFRSLSQRDLALLIQACHVRWRLGGGKSVSLGLCQPKIAGLCDEAGNPMTVHWQNKDGETVQWRDLVSDIQHRVKLWSATQTPVPFVRQPRARDNRDGLNGLGWFARFSQMKMDETPVGMQANKNHFLPYFDADDPISDWMKGYDA